MKYSITILLATLLVSLSGFSQEYKFQLGFDGGPNLSSIRGFDEIIPIKSKLGYSYALTIQYNFSNRFSILSGLGFEQKGYETANKLELTDENGNPFGAYTLRSAYNYLNIPVLARYTIGNNNLKGFAHLGGYMGVFLNRTTFLVGYDGQTDEQKQDSEGVENMDFGLSGGLGMMYSITNQLSLTLEIRNNLGLYNVSSVNVINDGTNMLNSTNLLLGIKYGFGEK